MSSPLPHIRETDDYILYTLFDEDGSRYVIENTTYHIIEWEGNVLPVALSMIDYLQGELARIQKQGAGQSELAKKGFAVAGDRREH